MRFNIRQAIFIDIALVFPSLLTGVFAYIVPELGYVFFIPYFCTLLFFALFLLFKSVLSITTIVIGV